MALMESVPDKLRKKQEGKAKSNENKERRDYSLLHSLCMPAAETIRIQ
jgi:hypothetical protein